MSEIKQMHGGAQPVRRASCLLSAAVASLLTACGAGDVQPSSPAAQPSGSKQAVVAKPTSVVTASARAELGTITGVAPLETQKPTTGAGAVIGGVLGAAVGSQVGGGDGKKAATVIGAVGGAVAGNEVEKKRKTDITGYRVDVRLDSGATRTVTLTRLNGFTNGQRVRLVNGALQPA